MSPREETPPSNPGPSRTAENISVLEFIPLLGPILGAVPGILLALSEGPDVAGYALLVYEDTLER